MSAVRLAVGAFALAGVLAGPLPLSAQAVRPGFNTTEFPRNDDASLAGIPIGFTINFFGVERSTLFLNNNGNVTFDAALSTFTPFPLSGTNRQIIAPFFADVDTRGFTNGGQPTRYGTGTVDSRTAWGATWADVGYYEQRTDKLNTFQLILIDRSDTGAGNFDFEFNYNRILWETGEASGGVNGLGGSSARVGWSNGAAASFELPGSAVPGSFLDTGPANTRLVGNSLNSNVLGRYVFQVRNGAVIPPPTVVPEPQTYALLATGLLALGLVARRKR